MPAFLFILLLLCVSAQGQPAVAFLERARSIGGSNGALAQFTAQDGRGFAYLAGTTGCLLTPGLSLRVQPLTQGRQLYPADPAEQP